jgi:hypothetical protein
MVSFTPTERVREREGERGRGGDGGGRERGEGERERDPCMHWIGPRTILHTVEKIYRIFSNLICTRFTVAEG